MHTYGEMSPNLNFANTTGESFCQIPRQSYPLYIIMVYPMLGLNLFVPRQPQGWVLSTNFVETLILCLEYNYALPSFGRTLSIRTACRGIYQELTWPSAIVRCSKRARQDHPGASALWAASYTEISRLAGAAWTSEQLWGRSTVSLRSFPEIQVCVLGLCFA